MLVFVVRIECFVGIVAVGCIILVAEVVAVRWDLEQRLRIVQVAASFTGEFLSLEFLKSTHSTV